MGRDVRGFLKVAQVAASILLSAKDVLVVGHNDADGLSSAAIASMALDRARIEHDVLNVKKLDENTIGEIESTKRDVIWLVDLGSGYMPMLDPTMRYCICDHHEVDPNCIIMHEGQVVFSSFYWDTSHTPSVNPLLYGLDGSRELSGAGCTFTVALAMDEGNRDLAALAVVGAVGDFQDNAEARLVGCNRRILSIGVEMGVLTSEEGLRPYGSQSRPLARWLELSNDPFIPGLSRRYESCVKHLDDLGIPLVDDAGRWRTYSDLVPDERRALASSLVLRLLESGKGPAQVWRLIGEVIELPKEERGTPLRSAKEYATLLNACGRYGEYDTALAVLKGDRGEALQSALRNQRGHSENIAKAIEAVRDLGVERRGHIQYFDAGSTILDTIVGIVAGMVLGSDGIPDDVPILAFADSDDGSVKVSARGNRKLVRRGLDLSKAMRQASESVGGAGGGHNVAAGATIPEGRKEDFLDAIDSIVASQLTP